jgi:electron transfer flavoprotein alpha/beta subunit
VDGGGLETLSLNLPAVTTDLRLNEPRYDVTCQHQ